MQNLFQQKIIYLNGEINNEDINTPNTAVFNILNHNPYTPTAIHLHLACDGGCVPTTEALASRLISNYSNLVNLSQQQLPVPKGNPNPYNQNMGLPYGAIYLTAKAYSAATLLFLKCVNANIPYVINPNAHVGLHSLNMDIERITPKSLSNFSTFYQQVLEEHKRYYSMVLTPEELNRLESGEEFIFTGEEFHQRLITTNIRVNPKPYIIGNPI